MKRFLPLFTSLFLILLLVIYLSFRVFELFKPFLPFTSYLLGIDHSTTYTILLGNDAEMRANGGFAGSYAKFKISSTRLDSLSSRVFEFFIGNPIPNPLVELDFQDIYVPNGQLLGLFVAPPEPIQQAFGHGTWELANADWEPDFPSAAKSLRWFLEKGKETNPDILAILNLTTIKKILSVVGSFPVPEYKATLTPDNLYLFLQGKAELNFFPGSTQKKDALTAVGQALVKKIKSLPLLQKFKIAQILYTDLQNQNIVINSLNPDFQNLLVDHNFAGVLQPEAMDTYSMIETNLGANKANAYVTRHTTHTITFTSQSPLSKGETPPQAERGISPNPTSENRELRSNYIHHSVTIQFQNASLEANPNPPFHYGGDYIAYLRLYLPENAQNITLTRTPEGKPPLDPKTSPIISTTPSIVIPGSDPESIPKCEILNVKCKISYGLTELGFWHTTRAGGESTISLSYDLPMVDSSSYTLAVLKQHSLTTSPQTILIGQQSFTNSLNQDFFYPSKR